MLSALVRYWASVQGRDYGQAFQEVLPDWRPSVRLESTAVGAAEVQLPAVVQRLQAFMSAHSGLESEAAESRSSREEPQRARKANASFIMALDHMLYSGIGRGLRAFMARQPCKALLDDEVRYWLPGDDGVSRACVKNTRTGSKRYELPVSLDDQGSVRRPSLHVISDEGSIGRVALLYLMSRTDLRGTCWQDPLHRHWNDTKLACQHSQLWSVIQEYTCVFNIHMAPWNQSAFHAVISKAGAEYCSNFSERNELFIHMYEELLADAGVTSMLTEPVEHMRELWSSLKASPHLHTEGDHVKLGRWYSFFREAESRAPFLAQLELFLIYVGIQQRWWDSYDSSPLGMDAGTGAEVEGEELARSEPEMGQAASSKSVQMSNEKESLKALRGTCKNTMQVVLCILKDKHKKRLLHVLMAAIAPFKKFFAELQSESKTSWGRLNTIMEMAYGSDLALICYRSLSSHADTKTMESLRLKRSSQGLHESEIADDAVVSEKYFHLVVQMSGQHLLSSMHYTHSWPGRMALLLSDDARLQETCLQEMKTMWEWLVQTEIKARTDSDVRSFLDDLQFPQWQWVREIALELWEHNFARIPPSVRDSLLDCFSGVYSTNIIEDSFNRLKRLASQAPNKKLRRQRRYHGLQASGLQDEYGAPAPKTATHNMSMSTLPSNLFEPNAETFTLEESALQEFLSSTWVAPSPQRYGLIPMAFQCCLQQSDWGQVRDSWLTLMLEDGCVAVHNASPTQAMLVLKVTKFGAILWPLSQINVGEKLHFAFQAPCVSTPLPWRVAFVNSLEDWKAARVSVLPPAAQDGDGVTASGCIRLELKAKPTRLCPFAAQRCFKGLQVPQLKLLWKQLGSPVREDNGRKPTTEYELCSVCLAQVLPDVNDEQRSEFMARRFKPREDSNDILFEAKNLEMVGQVLDEADKHDLEEARKAHTKRVGKASSARVTAQGSSSGSTVPVAQRESISLTGGHTPDEVKKYLPKNFRIALDDVRHKRWQVEDVLRRSSPYSYSKSYGDESVVSRTQALRMVLTTAWDRHKGYTGESCPFSFEAIAIA
eukprot:1647171-Amphidinium_carterae.3